MNIELLDSRRLTGPNLFWNLPGAILDFAVEGISAVDVIGIWRREVVVLMDAMGWPPEQVCSRVFTGGASVVINAPIDVLYTACELNELAFKRAVASLQGERSEDITRAINSLAVQMAEESNPTLLAMQHAASDNAVPFLWDDDEVSVGFGKTALTWPADQLPGPRSVDWEHIGTIPLGIVTGTNGKSTTVRLAASTLASAGMRAGITSTDYIRVGEKILDRGDYSGPGGARTLLRHPESETVVLEVARGGLLRRGIGVERADAAVVTNVAADHLGDYGINSVAEMAEAKFIVRRALSTDAALILNADDAESVSLAAELSNRIIWFSLDPKNPVIVDHVQMGGEAACLDDGALVMVENRKERKIVDAADVPVTFGGAAGYNIRNALAAMALCRELGADDRALAAGLKNFSGDAEVNPGRGNLFVKDGVRIFLDFAHNEHGVKAISETVANFDAKRNIVLMGQAGDRSDQDIDDLVTAACKLNIGRLLSCEITGYERGREPMAVPAMIRDIAIREGVSPDAIQLFSSPVEGVKAALADAQDGDCLVLLALSQRDEVLGLIKDYISGE